MKEKKLENINIDEIDMNDDLIAPNLIIEDTQELNIKIDLEKTQEINVVDNNE